MILRCKDPNNGVLGSNTINTKGIGALKPYHLSPWAHRVTPDLEPGLMVQSLGSLSQTSEVRTVAVINCFLRPQHFVL